MPVALPEPTWTDPLPAAIGADLAALAGHPLLARLLAARGFSDVSVARAFLDPAQRPRFDPTRIPGVPAAAERVRAAVRHREKVLVWGDFDADGQTATAVMVLALRRLGLDPEWYVPDRVTESHGLNPGVLARLNQATLVITCDCGVGDLAHVEALAAAGVDTIVTDHHPWPGIAAGWRHPARALVTPRFLADDDAAAGLTGVGAAYALAAALLDAVGQPHDDLLDLVALGTVVDVAAVTGENRHLAQLGLPRLNSGQRLGIRALLEAARRRPALNRDANIASYVIGPRLNAFGRLARGQRGVELLMTGDPLRATELAAEANALNLERQAQCDDVVEMARRWVESALGGDLPDLDAEGNPQPLPIGPGIVTDTALSLADPAWHPGIVGLAASRLAETFRRPVALAALGDGVARLSMRAGVEWADLSAALARIEREPGLGFRGGGHRAAAGGSVPLERLPTFQRLFAAALAEQAPPDPLRQHVGVDAELSLGELTVEACTALARMLPHGPGNAAPTLLVRGLRLTEPPRPLGDSGRHFKVRLIDERGIRAGAVWWDFDESRLPRMRFDALGAIEQSEFNGEAEVRLVIQAVRPAVVARPLLSR